MKQQDNTPHTGNTPGTMKQFGAELVIGKDCIALCSSTEANAERIVKAWNEYDTLKEQLKKANQDWGKLDELSIQLKAENKSLRDANRELLKALEGAKHIISCSDYSKTYESMKSHIGIPFEMETAIEKAKELLSSTKEIG